MYRERRPDDYLRKWITIRMSVSSVSEQGRATQGVKLIRVDDGDEIAAIPNWMKNPKCPKLVKGIWTQIL
jgi:DNA gyrase subunit A